MKQRIELTVNGEPHELLIDANALLINVIREQLHLTGTKYGCGTGQCGGCTLLVNGYPVLGCLTLAISVDKAAITTVEGLARSDGTLDPLQEAFLDTNAIQCGYCTPGMLLVAKNLLRDTPNPTEAEIRQHIKGNICRCTGYNGIVKAVKQAAAQQKSDERADASA